MVCRKKNSPFYKFCLLEEVSNMQKRMIGKSGIRVNPVGLGCMGFSHAYGYAMDEQETITVLRQAQEMGYDFFDTAEVYKGTLADGRLSWNEEVVGEALAPVRRQVVIATKMGIRINPDQSLSTDARPEAIRKSLEGSLKRLGTDYLDVYYQHRIDPAVEPEVVADTMARLIQEGKIRAWGISEANEDYLRRANAVCPVAAIQNRYSMMARWHENLFPVCEELGVSFCGFFSHGQRLPDRENTRRPVSLRTRRTTAPRCRSSRQKERKKGNSSWSCSRNWQTRKRFPWDNCPWPGCSARNLILSPFPVPGKFPV